MTRSTATRQVVDLNSEVDNAQVQGRAYQRRGSREHTRAMLPALRAPARLDQIDASDFQIVCDRLRGPALGPQRGFRLHAARRLIIAEGKLPALRSPLASLTRVHSDDPPNPGPAPLQRQHSPSPWRCKPTAVLKQKFQLVSRARLTTQIREGNDMLLICSAQGERDSRECRSLLPHAVLPRQLATSILSTSFHAASHHLLATPSSSSHPPSS